MTEPGMLEAMNAVKKRANAYGFPINGPRIKTITKTPIPPLPRGSIKAAQSLRTH
jgi:hypothetical protein